MGKCSKDFFITQDMLQQLLISTFRHTGIPLSFRTFGKSPGTAPVVLVNHALTGNSNAAGENGWWNMLIGDGKTIDTLRFSVIAFDIPGNGQNGFFIDDYENFSTRTIAQLFWDGLHLLNINRIFAIIGGSLGGAIAWEMAFLKPDRIEKIIPVACNYKASDWLIANVKVQEAILKNSSNALEDARMHAMLLYRTPESFQAKFNLERNTATKKHKVEEWLEYHAKTLEKRYKLKSYRLMNHLLKTIGNEWTRDDFESFLNTTQMKIHLIAVNSDYMFTKKEQYETFKEIAEVYKHVSFETIHSIHGHDAFLIEHQQLAQLTQPYFKAN